MFEMTFTNVKNHVNFWRSITWNICARDRLNLIVPSSVNNRRGNCRFVHELQQFPRQTRRQLKPIRLHFYCCKILLEIGGLLRRVRRMSRTKKSVMAINIISWCDTSSKLLFSPRFKSRDQYPPLLLKTVYNS